MAPPKPTPTPTPNLASLDKALLLLLGSVGIVAGVRAGALGGNVVLLVEVADVLLATLDVEEVSSSVTLK